MDFLLGNNLKTTALISKICIIFVDKYCYSLRTIDSILIKLWLKSNVNRNSSSWDINLQDTQTDREIAFYLFKDKRILSIMFRW